MDILDIEIMKYLGKIRGNLLTEEENREHQAQMTAISNLENIADILESEMVDLAKAYLDGEYQQPSDETRDMVWGLWDSVRRALDLSVQAVGQNDQRLAQDVFLMKSEIRDLADRFFERHAGRLNADDPKYLERVRL